jgi:uncharacterized damage-inducible protein DinB
MRITLTRLATAAALVLTAAPLSAQEPEHEHEGNEMMMMMGAVMPDLVTDLEQVRTKLLGLAEAIPTDSWNWRPGEGVRSVSEVFRHVVADNYFLPASMGVEAPESTGVLPNDYGTVQAFEEMERSPAEVIALMEASFDHLFEAMQAEDGHQLDRDVSAFGQEFTAQGLWVLTTTHLHEHLGQMIAYARMNGVVPPWSM